VPPPDITLAVVGADFPNERGPTRRFELAMCSQGEPVELRPEPKNKADRNAVAVYSCRGIQIGYVTAERAPRIGQLINQGADVRAAFHMPTRFGAYIRVSFDGNDPDLPPDMPEADSEPDWYPDEEWPDE
jgi:hypothetical protein